MPTMSIPSLFPNWQVSCRVWVQTCTAAGHSVEARQGGQSRSFLPVLGGQENYLINIFSSLAGKHGSLALKKRRCGSQLQRHSHTVCTEMETNASAQRLLTRLRTFLYLENINLGFLTLLSPPLTPIIPRARSPDGGGGKGASCVILSFLDDRTKVWVPLYTLNPYCNSDPSPQLLEVVNAG